jgi:hypothetical protein
LGLEWPRSQSLIPSEQPSHTHQSSETGNAWNERFSRPGRCRADRHEDVPYRNCAFSCVTIMSISDEVTSTGCLCRSTGWSQGYVREREASDSAELVFFFIQHRFHRQKSVFENKSKVHHGAMVILSTTISITKCDRNGNTLCHMAAERQNSAFIQAFSKMGLFQQFLMTKFELFSQPNAKLLFT